ncbi:hypothetical protein F5Y18DRAFT_442283 [Xylariaceae sp. FL1019]|nr:hypothetical protein F5Y18DRAFT_442283 [Xylariaceae sp. FL1019]
MPGITFDPRPIFLVTHPRACSTAFERVFLTRAEDIQCVHEPFSDAYHWGPEKLTERYENVEVLRAEKGLEEYTYRAALDAIDDARSQGKRVFVKDMGKCLLPLHGDTPWIAPSLRSKSKCNSLMMREYAGIGVPNPTVLPLQQLAKFQYTFLIRNPRKTIPSLYECSTPPKSLTTGWHGFKAEDAGYKDMRRLFEYLVRVGLIGPNTTNEICVVDAEDLLECPEDIINQYCASVDVPFDPSMLRWSSEYEQKRAKDLFKNWAPFHDVVLRSTSLQSRRPNPTTPEADVKKWTQKYGSQGAAIIQQNIEDNMEHYLFLKQFALTPTRT